MAIVIPSKNIYKIDNNKIIDNKIGKVVSNENLFTLKTDLLNQQKNVVLTEIANQDDSTTTEVYNDISKNAYATNIVEREYSSGDKYYYYATELTFDLSELFVSPSQINDLKFYVEEYSYIRQDFNGSKMWRTLENKAYSETFKVIINDFISQGKTITFGGLYIRDLSIENSMVKVTIEAFKNRVGNGTAITPTSTSYYNLNIFGNSYTKEQQNIAFGNTEKEFSLNSNELSQAENIYDTQSLTNYVANNILTKYSNGKETATLLCDIDNYYNENGVKIIDLNTNKITFAIGDIVIPMALDENGKEKPISVYKNGTPKQFKIIKHKISYNGMLFQELQCQEI